MFAQRLKQLRETKGITQSALGKTLGVTQQTVGSWETGRTTPDPGTLGRLASHFQVSLDYLLGHANERLPGAGVKAIDDPDTLAFMQQIVGDFRTDPDLTDKDRQEILEDLAEYFRFKLQQKKNRKTL